MSGYRRKKKNRAGRFSIACIVILLLAVMSVQIVRLNKKNQEYDLKEADLTEQLEQETERRDQLAEYKEYVGSQEYIKDIANAILSMVEDNQIIFREEKK